MDMTQETLEILIGKYLDGEITPAESRLLQTEIECNAQAREVFEQMQRMNQLLAQAVTAEILRDERGSDKVFERAWQQTKRSWRPRFAAIGRRRFAAGLAAGFVLALLVQFVVLRHGAPADSEGGRHLAIETVSEQPESPGGLIKNLPRDFWPDVTRNIDWYSFTDDMGTDWLIQGFRENIVRPAVYQSDL